MAPTPSDTVDTGSIDPFKDDAFDDQYANDSMPFSPNELPCLSTPTRVPTLSGSSSRSSPLSLTTGFAMSLSRPLRISLTLAGSCHKCTDMEPW